MPIEQLHGAALAQQHEIHVSYTAGDQNGQGQLNEDQRRRGSAVVQTVTTSAPAATGGAVQPTNLPVPAPPSTGILDRFHKWAISGTGGYIMVGLGHAPNDIPGQFPPSNPGALYLATVSSITEAYNMAVAAWALPVVTSATGRITICVMAGTWIETNALAFQTPGIDIQGVGKPTIYWNATIQTLCDMSIYDCNIVAYKPLHTGAICLLPAPDLNPLIPKNSFYRCKFSGDFTAMVAQSRFYAEDCHWYQTQAPPSGLSTLAVPLNVMLDPTNQIAPTRIFGGSINALSTPQQRLGGIFGTDVNMGFAPSGYALVVLNPVRGPFSTVGDFGDPLYLWPNVHLELDRVLVMGSLSMNGGRVQHTHCEIHGGISFPSETGYVYASLTAQQFLNGDGSFNGYFGTELMFDNCVIRSHKIAMFVTNGDDAHPGMSLVYVNTSSHKTRWDSPADGPWTPLGAGNGTALICNSGTGSLDWTASGPTVTLFGSCPNSVTSLRDFYMM